MRLVLADGTIINDGTAGYAGGNLWLKLPGMTMPEAAAVVFDSTKTEVIRFDYGEMRDTYEGYTTCVNLCLIDGVVNACMQKGAAE